MTIRDYWQVNVFRLSSLLGLMALISLLTLGSGQAGWPANRAE